MNINHLNISRRLFASILSAFAISSIYLYLLFASMLIPSSSGHAGSVLGQIAHFASQNGVINTIGIVAPYFILLLLLCMIGTFIYEYSQSLSKWLWLVLIIISGSFIYILFGTQITIWSMGGSRGYSGFSSIAVYLQEFGWASLLMKVIGIAFLNTLALLIAIIPSAISKNVKSKIGDRP